MERYDTIVLGAGPAGIGLLVCAAQRGELAALLDRGLAIVERGARIGAGTLGDYVLNSDSLATSFVECLETGHAPPLLEPVARLPAANALIRGRERHAPLPRVAEFLGQLGETVRCRVDSHPHSTVLARTTAHALTLRGDGDVEVALDGPETSTERRLVARSIVLALGGCQDLEAALCASVGGAALREHAERILLSDALLSRAGTALLRARLPAHGARVVVVGGSHSAFSVAWLLTRGEPGLSGAAVTLLHRNRLRVFYPSPQAALADGYAEFDGEDVCPRTGRVHRLGGLRGDGRELWRRVTGRAHRGEERVTIRRIGEPGAGEADVRRILAQAHLIVPAFGYRARTLPLHDPAGERLPLRADAGGTLVGADARVVLASGPPLQRILGLGFAAGWQPPGEASFHGQTNGVWLYHNVYGERVLDSLGANRL